MTIMDVIYKGILFFVVFYGAIILTSLISKKFIKRNEKRRRKSKPLLYSLYGISMVG